MAIPSQPTLIYPNGGEEIKTRELRVQWDVIGPISFDNLPVLYEIFYAENYDYTNEPDWIAIATIPSDVNFFDWKVGSKVKGSNVRIGISSVNTRGERSDMSISSSSFAIKRSVISVPAILAPLSNSKHGDKIEIIFDSSAIKGTYSERAKYYIYYSSAKTEIPLTPIGQKLPASIDSFMWDTSLLPPSDDYKLTVYLSDDDGNRGPEVSIRNISIVSEGFFIIDTKPPVGILQINGGEQFTRERDVMVKMLAFDESTNIHSLKFIQEGQEGNPEAYITSKFVRLTDGDGEKKLEVLFQDFGGNRSSELGKKFRILIESGNVVDAIINENNRSELWVAVNTKNSLGELHKVSNNISSLFSHINEPITSLSFYNGEIYIGVNTLDDTAKVYKGNIDNTISLVFSLTDEGSEVNSMIQFGSNLYIGTTGGGVYQFDGSTVILLKKFSNGIKSISSDKTLLYILTVNSVKVNIYDGNSFSEVTAL